MMGFSFNLLTATNREASGGRLIFEHFDARGFKLPVMHPTRSRSLNTEFQ